MSDEPLPPPPDVLAMASWVRRPAGAFSFFFVARKKLPSPVAL